MFSSDSEHEMVDELTSLIRMFHSIKKFGTSVIFTISTLEGQATRSKLEAKKTPKIENFGLKVCSLGSRGTPQ